MMAHAGGELAAHVRERVGGLSILSESQGWQGGKGRPADAKDGGPHPSSAFRRAELSAGQSLLES